MKLNSEQTAAVDSTCPNIVCVAGPGSGKTATLVARVLRLIEGGAQAREIVVITYTVAAARELAERLSRSGVSERLGYIGTLHSFVLRLLRKHNELAGLPETLTVIDDDAREAVVERLRLDMRVKDSSEACIAAANDREASLPVLRGALLNKVQCLGVEYHRTLRRNGLLDFNTILWNGLALARRLDSTELGFKHLFVDEYQDAADADDQIYGLLPFETRFYVGDPDQAIYGFRGGNFKNFTSKVEEPGVPAQVARWEVHLLEDNYRSREEICVAAQSLIVHNEERVRKVTASTRGSGSPVVVMACDSEGSERVKLLQRLTGDWLPKGLSVAVLCRTNRLASELATFLRDGGLEVAQRTLTELPADWRKAKIYLALLSNPFNDFVAHQWLAEVEGEQRANAIKTACALNHKSINEENIKLVRPSAGNQFDAVQFCKLSFESRARLTDAAAALEPDAGLEDLVFALARLEESREQIGSGVVVSTIHSAKGREWDAVWVAGCEEETLFGRGVDPATPVVEEERRLFYVAMTRARDELVLSWCRSRPLYRGPNVRPGDPQPRTRSRFIAEAGL